MKHLADLCKLALLAGVASATVFDRADRCDANNCLRALEADARKDSPQTDVQGDCQAYVDVVVSPCPTRTTLTFVQESGGSAPYTDATTPTPVFTDACPVTSTYGQYLPPYAETPCDNDVQRYFTACSCLGYPAITYDYPASAVVVTATTTASAQPTVCAREFVLVPVNKEYAGQFLSQEPSYAAVTLNGDISLASVFFLDPELHTVNVSLNRYSDYGPDEGSVFVAFPDEDGYLLQFPPQDDSAGTVSPLVCSIEPDGGLPNSGILSCHNSANEAQNTFQTNTDGSDRYTDVTFGSGKVGDSYDVLQLRAVPVCDVGAP